MENSSEQQQYDAIVVGAGIMGSCAAYYIARSGGRRVLLLEQFDLLHHRGSSHGESRTIRATYPEPYYPAMALESSLLWSAAESESGYRVVTRTPQLDLGPVSEPSLQLIVDNCRSNSVPVRVLDSDELAGMFSGVFRLPEGWIGVLSEIGGVIKPTKAVAMFQMLAIKNGAVIRDRTEVIEIQRENEEIGGGLIAVSTSSGERFWGKKCVITAGAWTRKLMSVVRSAPPLPIQPLHTMICYWKIREGREKDLSSENGFPTFSSYGNPCIYGTPAMEFPGLIKIAPHEGYPCDPDRRNWETDLELLRRTVSPWIERIMPGTVDSGSAVATQSCMYSMTPDGDYVVDFLGGEFGEDVVVAGGFSGHGFKMGPVVGRVVADLAIDGEAAGVELGHFRISRFDANPGGNLKKYGNH